jgi:signal transduction histidine kinase
VILADWAAIAIENARLYQTSELRRSEIEQAFRELEATQDVAEAIGGELSPQRLLELIVKRGRALVNARTLVVMLRDGDELVVETAAGHVGLGTGVRLPMSGSAYGDVLEQRRSELVPDVSARMRTPTRDLCLDDPQTALLVPMIHRGEPLGILVAFDRGEQREAFTARDERMLQAFAANAATAVALARSVEFARLRTSLAAADAERRRWARELHDETLQGLGALRVLLSAALQREDPAQDRSAMREAIEHIEREIANLRALISELRPAALDELGLGAAIEALVDRQREHGGPAIEAQLALTGDADGRERLDGELEMTVYRLVQEALTNVAKHAHARNVHVSIARAEGNVLVEVRDDGAGFDTSAPTEGFGLTGMRERASQAGGTLRIASSERGTFISASMPVTAVASDALRSVGP